MGKGRGLRGREGVEAWKLREVSRGRVVVVLQVSGCRMAWAWLGDSWGGGAGSKWKREVCGGCKLRERYVGFHVLDCMVETSGSRGSTGASSPSLSMAVWRGVCNAEGKVLGALTDRGVGEVLEGERNVLRSLQRVCNAAATVYAVCLQSGAAGSA